MFSLKTTVVTLCDITSFPISFAKICKGFLISKLFSLKIVKNIVKTAKIFGDAKLFYMSSGKYTIFNKKYGIFGYFPFLHYIYKCKG